MREDNKKSKANIDDFKNFKTSIGGQALIEGIMMRGPSKISIVVRTNDGIVETSEVLKPLKEKYPILGFPFIRGVVNLGSSMKQGVRSIMYSAEQMPEEEQENPSKFDAWLEKKLSSEKAEKVIITFAVIFGMAFSIALFMLLPTFLAGFVARYVESPIIKNLIEGGIRILIFLTYLWLTSKMSYIKRVWAYHGAEHMAIYCYEKGLPLTLENVKKQSTLHPRCGTSFLFIVMIVSIFVFSFISWDNLFVRFILRIALLPIVVSISYEIIRLAGRYNNIFTRIVSAPGRALQKLTTSTPDDDMLEVAIHALQAVIPEDKKEATW
ncbi:MAG: DUF1385 domain-containing protein [Oscillospiraceae bacterium]|jgi:uncharacterized protein YqhQ|nr:DUF1385 domain-containing protein [Oscillospiraceae bacterium]